VLAVGDGLHDHFLGHAVATDQLDDDIDFRIVDQRKRVIGHPGSTSRDLLGQFHILVGNCGDANRTTGATGDFFRIAIENGPGTTADGADADQANIDRFHLRRVK